MFSWSFIAKPQHPQKRFVRRHSFSSAVRACRSSIIGVLLFIGGSSSSFIQCLLQRTIRRHIFPCTIAFQQSDGILCKVAPNLATFARYPGNIPVIIVRGVMTHPCDDSGSCAIFNWDALCPCDSSASHWRGESRNLLCELLRQLSPAGMKCKECKHRSLEIFLVLLLFLFPAFPAGFQFRNRHTAGGAGSRL